jgi:chromosome segregation ATPase
MDSSDNSQWLTYDEIAEARGTEKVGAIRWVQRHKWRRQPGNDGLVRVLVPQEALVRTTLRGQQQSRTVTPLSDGGTAAVFEAALAALREAHAGELAAMQKVHDSALTVLQEQLRTIGARHVEELTALREQLLTAAARHAEELAALQEQSRTTEAHHAEELVAFQEQWHTTQARHVDELAALQGQLHTATTRADGLAADLTALGEQLRTAENRAGAAQEATETLQATVDELKAGQGRHAGELEQARIEAQEAQKAAEAHIANLEADAAAKDTWIAQAEANLEAARRDAETAQQAATEFRLTEEARKARGRLRRAWDGWSGR